MFITYTLILPDNSRLAISSNMIFKLGDVISISFDSGKDFVRYNVVEIDLYEQLYYLEPSIGLTT